MSAGRRAASRFADDETINDLILKLQELLPNSNQGRRSPRCHFPAPARPSREEKDLNASEGWRIVKETCSYIKRLQREVEELSERLSHLLNSLDDVNTSTVTVEYDQLVTTLLSLLQQHQHQHQHQS